MGGKGEAAAAAAAAAARAAGGRWRDVSDEGPSIR